MRASPRKLALVAVGLCVIGFILYRSRTFFHFGDFSGAKLLHAVRDANIPLLALSVVAIYACYALRSLRWQVFQRNLGPSHFWNIYKLTLAGFSALFLLGRAGEPIRPLLLARKEKLPIADMFGIYVLERIFDIASAAVIAAIGFFLQPAAKTTGSLLFAGVITAVAALVYLRLHGTFLLERRLQAVLATQSWQAKFARIVLGVARGVQTLRTWGQLVLAVLYSTAHWFLVLLVYLWVSHSFGGALGAIRLRDAMVVLAFTLFGSAVQAPGVGGGSQAASFIAYTAIFGVEREPAAAAAIVLWLISFAMCSVVGVPLLIHEGWSLGQLREIARHEGEIVDQEMAGSSGDTKARLGESAE